MTEQLLQFIWQFRYLRGKYRLSPIHQPVLLLRMRPYNFPSVRLAQLAMLSHQSAPWWARIKETNSVAELKMTFNITAGSYRDQHYVPDECSAFKKKKLGLHMTECILINTAVPLLYAYGRLRKEPSYIDRTMQWLSSMKPENHSITGRWAGLGVRSQNASGSQALLELKARYCDPKKCLECAIGKSLLSYQS